MRELIHDPQNPGEFIITLPPVQVEARTRTAAETRPYSWGLDFLKVRDVWAKTKGRGVIAFAVDTEDWTDHPAVEHAIIPEYCARFTTEAPAIISLGGHGLHVMDTILQVAPEIVGGLVKGLDNSRSGSTLWIANAIRFTADVKLLPQHNGYKRVVNLSLGSDVSSPAMKAAIEYARGKGVHFFFAAGNDSRDVDFPGAHKELGVTVAALNEDGTPADFSSPGPEVDLAAPGRKIWGAYRGGYAQLSGTSMATPHCAGLGSLILSLYDVVDLEKFMIERAADSYTPGFDNKTGYGIPYAPGYFSGDVEPEPEEPPVEEPVTAWPWWAWVAAGVGLFGIGFLLTKLLA